MIDRAISVSFRQNPEHNRQLQVEAVLYTTTLVRCKLMGLTQVHNYDWMAQQACGLSMPLLPYPTVAFFTGRICRQLRHIH